MIEISQIVKRFRKQTVLNNISISFKEGHVYALIGPNGSGKTTLIKSILGLVRPDAGTLLFNGKPVDTSVDYRNHIGYMPQIGRYPDNMTIGQLFSMIKNIRKEKQNVNETLFRQFALEQMQSKPMRTLSGGTRQKVSAALAFLFDPAVLILDEPTAGLDPLSTEILKDKIRVEKEKGKLIIITSHVLSDLEEFTTDVVYLQEGQLMFNRSIMDLQEDTGQEKLGKMVAYMMKKQLNAETQITD